MPDWKEVNERRISEKSQEIMLYCSQTRKSMTARSFELAKLSLRRLLVNIIDRNPMYKAIPETVLSSLDTSSNRVAICSEKQASALAKAVVYNAISDDLDLYPVLATQKYQRSKSRGETQCHITTDEMTQNDMLYVIHEAMHGGTFSKETILSIYNHFRGINIDPYQLRLLAECHFSDKQLDIRSLPQYFTSSSKYQEAATRLVEKELIRKVMNGVYERTNKEPGKINPSEEFDEPVIRQAEARDLPGVNALLQQVLAVHNAGRPDLFYETGKKYTDRQLLEIFDNPETPVLIYKDGNSVLGYAFCVIQNQSSGAIKPVRTLYIDDFCVDETSRGKHIGSELFDYVKVFAREKGCYNITLHVWECNPVARAFYDSLGMKPQFTSMELLVD